MDLVKIIQKRNLTNKIQAQIDKNNAHITNPLIYRLATKEEKKQLKAQQNTIPLIKWI